MPELLVLTPLNITVTRLAQEGIPVKRIAVPDVEACDVPAVKSGLNCVPLVWKAINPLLSAVVTRPDDVEALIVTAMTYNTTHFEPPGTVTATPLLTVIGPADTALLPDGIA